MHKTVGRLDLSTNRIGGTLPTELAMLTKLSSDLLLNHNSLTGTLPSYLGYGGISVNTNFKVSVS